MIAELAAFNAAFGVVKGFIANGKDLHDCFGQIGQMVNTSMNIPAAIGQPETMISHVSISHLV
jgi:hypothetical protein